MMIRKILMGLTVFVLLAGVIGCSAAVMPPPGPPPTTPPTPTQTPTPSGAISVQEFIKNAQAGKYKTGDLIEVSGVRYETKVANIIMYVIFGPKIDGLGIVAEPDEYAINYVKLVRDLNEGDEVTIQGRYKGIGRIDAYPYRNGPDFVVLTKVKLIIAGK